MYQVMLVTEGKDEGDYTFTATDEEFELEYQDMLVRACEEADIDTHDVINVISQHVPDEE